MKALVHAVLYLLIDRNFSRLGRKHSSGAPQGMSGFSTPLIQSFSSLSSLSTSVFLSSNYDTSRGKHVVTYLLPKKNGIKCTERIATSFRREFLLSSPVLCACDIQNQLFIGRTFDFSFPSAYCCSMYCDSVVLFVKNCHSYYNTSQLQGNK